MLKTKKPMLKNRLLKDFSVVLAAAAGAGAAAAVVVASSTVPAAAAALGFTSRVATTGTEPQRFSRRFQGFPTSVEGAIFEIKYNETKDTIEKIEGFWTPNQSVHGQEPEGVYKQPFMAWDANVPSLTWHSPQTGRLEFSPENPQEITSIYFRLWPDADSRSAYLGDPFRLPVPVP